MSLRNVCNVVCILLGLLKVSVCFEWTSSSILPNQKHIPACVGQNVTLLWGYTKADDEHIMDVEWRFNNGSGPVVIATEVNDHFFMDAESSQELKYSPNAGISLLNVKPNDTGIYTVTVNLDVNGVVQKHEQSVNLDVTDVPVAIGNGPHVILQGARFLNSSREDHLILSCGIFNPVWLPSVNVTWTTSTNHTLPSTFQDGGQFYLAVPNPLFSGEYRCQVDNSSPAAVCLNKDSHFITGAKLYVDDIQGRLTLLESKVQTLVGRIETLLLENSQLDSQVQILQLTNSNLAQQLQALQTPQTTTTAAVSQISPTTT